MGKKHKKHKAEKAEWRSASATAYSGKNQELYGGGRRGLSLCSGTRLLPAGPGISSWAGLHRSVVREEVLSEYVRRGGSGR